MLKFNDGFEFEEGEAERRIQAMQEFQLSPTRFGFLNDHYGLRKQCRHVLLGTSGTGKSTILRSILLDIARNHRVLLYSSEESLEQTKDMMALRQVKSDDIRNLSFLHEEEVLEACSNDIHRIEEWARILSVQVLNSEAEALFIDNITTSAFYDGNSYESQIKVINEITGLIKRFNIPVFIVAHTKKGVKDEQQTLIGPDDVKGPTALTNKTEFLYVYQKFMGETGADVEKTFGTIRVRKGRGVSNIDSTYLLDFDINRREYFGDAKIPFRKFGEIYSDRARLGNQP